MSAVPLHDRRTWSPGSRGLELSAWVSAGALVIATGGLLISGDVITGAPAWAKPAKFGVSITVYVLTLAWLLRLVEGHRRVVALLGGVTAGALVAELVLIDLQVLRSTTSHFNDATPFDSAVFTMMGALISTVFVAAFVAAVLLMRQRSLVGPWGTAVRAGSGIALLGMAEAVLMLANRRWQPAGGHTVGAVDGGPGLPFFGWSTEHGDLRIAHFVGLHALQALPLVAWLITRHVRADPSVQRALVRLVASGYAVVVVLLAWQAERGQALLSPDALVSSVALAAVVALAGGALLVLRGRVHT